MKSMNKYLIALFFVIGLLSCGSEEYNKTTGGVTARAVWPDEDIVSQSVSAAVMPPSIITVRMIVSSPGMANVQSDFPASAGQGTVNDIPAGADRTLKFQGLDSGGILTYEGEINDITIIADKITDAGKACMFPMIPSVTPPDPPLNVKAVAEDKEVKLEWESCATSFKVYRDIYAGVSKQTHYIDDITHNIDDISTESIPYTWTGHENGAPLENGTTYYFVVTAVNSYGESDASEEVNATPQPSDYSPDPPSNISIVAGDKKVTLNWDSVDGATNYKVYRNIVTGVSKFNYIDQITTSSMPYTWTGNENGAPLENGTTYYFVVTTVNSYGESEESVEVNATPEIPGPDCKDEDNDQYGEGSDCLGPDCNDNDENIHPGATEVCDNMDNDCNGKTDEGLVYTPTSCGKGECGSTGEMQCVNGGLLDTCVPGNPTTEICDGKDNDCDGQTDDGITDTPTTCGQGECESTGVRQCVNGGYEDTCKPGSPSTEICDGEDNDCDGSTDETGDALCDNGLYCDGQETCGGTAGCQDGSPPCSSGETCNESTDTCPANVKTVFVTSTTYTGNLGGVAGANQKCMSRASAGGLSGSYKAWISDSSGKSPSTTFTRSARPYVLIDGTEIANNYGDLTDGALKHMIDRDEYGNFVVHGKPWTGTQTDGAATGLNCSNWSSPSPEEYPTRGDTWTGHDPESWTDANIDNPCSEFWQLYCFEQ